MNFSSHTFLFFFLPLALAGYFLAPSRWRLVVLTITSYAFYGWANPWFCLVLLTSTLVDFSCGNLLDGIWRTKRPLGPAGRRFILGLSITSNLGMLLAFKYLVFAAENLDAIAHSLGLPGPAIPAIILPAGISFYTFESISYMLDIYRGQARSASAWVLRATDAVPTGFSRLRAELHALSAFACYITQFPHLVAGPIIRYQDMEAQLHRNAPRLALAARGTALFSLGLAKKILLANPAGDVADTVFAAQGIDAGWSWLGSAAYGLQLYFDFSGYSDMALGLGMILGFSFPRNFDAPYRSCSITEFWRRWHISLSTWLRDYVYVPLGGNRRGPVRTYANLLTVMLLAGFWHGAAWTFVAWGGFHGLLLVLERLRGHRPYWDFLPIPLQVLCTCAAVCIGWVFFRSNDMHQALAYLQTMAGMGGAGDTAVFARATLDPWHMLVLIVGATLAVTRVQALDWTAELSPVLAMAAFAALVASLALLWTQSSNPFLYFRF